MVALSLSSSLKLADDYNYLRQPVLIAMPCRGREDSCSLWGGSQVHEAEKEAQQVVAVLPLS